MKKNFTVIIILVAITFVILYFIFKPIIRNPDGYLFAKSGETLKGYYNFSYNLKYGSGYKPEGVNYPYYEHIQFDNNQPFHLLITKIKSVLIPISDSGVGIINISMIFSILLAIPFIFLILRRSKLPVWYASIITLIILFLSPQLQRFHAQIEMSFLFFIPLIWFLLIKFHDGNKKWLWGSLLFLSGTAGGFIDKYYLAFYTILIISVILADCWINRKHLNKLIRPGIILLVLVIVPVLIVNGYTFLTGWVNDRPLNLYGFFIYKANLFSIFLPFEQLFKLLPENIYNMTGINWEGHAYVGLPAMIVAVLFSLMVIYRFYTRKNIAEIFPYKELNTFLLGAFLILLFSMCIPGTGVLAKIFPSLNHFRALGRFSWIFYYIFTIYTAVYLFNYFKKLREDGKIKKSVWIMVLALLFWSYDAYTNVAISFKNIAQTNDKLEKTEDGFFKKIEQAGHKPEQYQAILFLPFANITGDKLTMERGLNAFAEAMKVSYNTGIPIFESFSPYISYEKALSYLQILSDSSIRKSRFEDINKDPLLLVCTKENFSKEEKWIKDNSLLLWEDKYISISSLSPEVFKESLRNWNIGADSIKNTLQGNEFMKSDTVLQSLYYLNFDDYKSKSVFMGKGAQYKKQKNVILFEENFVSKGFTGNNNLSFWMFFDTRVYNIPKATINIIDKYGLVTDTISLSTRQEYNVYNNWIRVDQNINFKEGFVYQLKIEGKYITVDNLLIQPQGSNVYIKSGNIEIMNNFVME